MGSAELIDSSDESGRAGEGAMQYAMQLTRANNAGWRDERRNPPIWSFARRSPRALGRARSAYLALARSRFASACKSLLISRAGTAAMAVPLAKSATAGIVNPCRSLLIARPPPCGGGDGTQARFADFAAGPFAGACRFLLISRAGTAAMAVPLAKSAAAGIVNPCRSYC